MILVYFAVVYACTEYSYIYYNSNAEFLDIQILAHVRLRLTVLVCSCLSRRSSRAMRCARSRTRMCWCGERPVPRSARASGPTARRQEARVHVMNDHEARVPAVQLAARVQRAHVLEPLVCHLQPREQQLRSVSHVQYCTVQYSTVLYCTVHIQSKFVVCKINLVWESFAGE